MILKIKKRSYLFLQINSSYIQIEKIILNGKNISKLFLFWLFLIK